MALVAFDLAVAERVRRALSRRAGLAERRMFGGIAFLLDGSMFCGVLGRDLVLRLGEAGTAAALRRRHVRPMDFTGRPIRTMVYVGPGGYRSDRALREWVRAAVAQVRSDARKLRRPRRQR